MTATTCILALATTLLAGGAGLAAAALTALITSAAALRYLAYSAALVMAVVPLAAGVPIAGPVEATPAGLTGLAQASVLHWAIAAPAGGWLWTLARVAPALLVVYAVGAGVCLLRLTLRWTALRKLVGGASPVDPAQLGAAASDLPVRVSDHVASALLVGIRRPVVVLPTLALAQMDAAQLGFVLAHEAAHARRGDNLRLLAEAVFRAALWFNPFIAWAAGRAAEAREQLCDQAVLHGADAGRRRAYAETLLLALRLGAQPQLASSLITPGRRKLVVRFNTILNPVRSTPTKAAAALGLIAVAGLLASLAGAAAWAQSPTEAAKPMVEAPADIISDKIATAGCETIYSGHVTVQQQGRIVKADLLRVLAAGVPGGCGRLESVVAYGDVTAQTQGRVEHGQLADIDLTSGVIAVH